MPFSHDGLKTTTGIQVFSQANKYTLSYRFLHGNDQGRVFAKNRPVSLNWTDYNSKYGTRCEKTCLVVVGRLFLAVPLGCLGFVIVVFPDHTYYYFWGFRQSEFQTSLFSYRD